MHDPHQPIILEDILTQSVNSLTTVNLLANTPNHLYKVLSQYLTKTCP